MIRRFLRTAVNERDALGSDLVPDYMTSVREGGFYGWPFSYYGSHIDTRVHPQRPDLVASAIMPDYALGAHTASLGLAITSHSGLPAPFTNGAFIGQHGSWNRRPPSGYRVIFVPFEDGKPTGEPVDVLAGFLDRDGQAVADRSVWRWTTGEDFWSRMMSEMPFGGFTVPRRKWFCRSKRIEASLCLCEAVAQWASA